MATIPLDDFRDLLACPCCRSPLGTKGTSLRCLNSSCKFSGHGFPVVSGQPILVDFDGSVLDEAATLRSAVSPIARTQLRPELARLKEWILGTNPVADRNIQRLSELLPNGPRRPIVLVVGGGSQGAGTAPIYSSSDVGVIGFDVYASPLTQFVADGHRIPLADQSVDAVLAQFVLEHVLDPSQVVAEIHRVLKPNGLVYAEVPFLQHVHEGPYDFTRFTQCGLRWLFRRFAVVDSDIERGVGSQLLWTIDHSTRALFRSKRAGHLAKALCFWVRYLDRFTDRRFSSDSASAFYLLARKAEQDISPQEVIAFYRGAQRPA